MGTEGDLTAALTFQRGGARASLERVALLEAIAELGSISGAAKRLGLSYKGAWDAVQAMNNLFEGPLIAAAPGGRAGGARGRGGRRGAAACPGDAADGFRRRVG